MRDVRSESAPAGFLRLFVAFHEAEALGAGRSVLNALASLAEYGWTPSGWLPGEGPLAKEAAGVLAWSASADKPIRYSARGWRSEPGLGARMRATPAYLRRFREALLQARPHVVHANTLRTLPEARVARALGLPVVVHVHELPAPSAKRALALRAASGVADALVVVSEAVARIVRPHAGRTPVLVAHNGVPRVEARLGDTPGPPVVGTIGTVCHAKGTDVFFEAAALARRERPALRFEHVGQWGLDEDAAFGQRARTLAAAPDLADALRVHGRESGLAALARWQIFVLPSREDAFPLASLEAMAAGVPVVASAVGGLVEQVEHLESGILVNPDDSRSLASWIVRLHDDAALRRQLAQRAVRRVRDRFTVERQAAVLHRAYLAALNLRHGPPPVRRATLESV